MAKLSSKKSNLVQSTIKLVKPDQPIHQSVPSSSITKHRSDPNGKWVGAHVSAANGLQNSVTNSVAINGNAIALFLKNQRTFSFSPLQPSVISDFKEACCVHGYDPKKHFLPHGSYLINLGNPDEEKRAKSYGLFLDDLKRCEQLGIGLYNFHPGSTVGQCSRQESIRLIANAINAALKETSSVVVVLENMAGQGNVIGSTFEELDQIIKQVEPSDRIGVCLDTCHMFAAGYDIRTKAKYDQVMADFDRIVGFDRLRGIHLNDSKEGLGSGKDRHENIGKGKIGLEGFRLLMNDKRLVGIPMVLETPDSDGESLYAKEIELLYSLISSE